MSDTHYKTAVFLLSITTCPIVPRRHYYFTSVLKCPIRANPDWVKADSPYVTKNKQKGVMICTHPTARNRNYVTTGNGRKTHFRNGHNSKSRPRCFSGTSKKKSTAFLHSVCDVETPARHKNYNRR